MKKQPTILHGWQARGGEYYNPSTGGWEDNDYECERCGAETSVSLEAAYGREDNAFTEPCPEHRDECSKWRDDDCNCQPVEVKA
jgi:hypothetical protein